MQARRKAAERRQIRGAQDSFALATLALGSPATRAPGCAQNSGGGLRTELALPPALASLAWARGSRFAPGCRRSGARVPASRGLRRPPARPFGCRAPSRLRRLPLHTDSSGRRRLGLTPSRPCPVRRAPCGRRGGSLRSPAAILSGSSGGLRAFARPRRPRLAHGPLAVARIYLFGGGWFSPYGLRRVASLSRPPRGSPPASSRPRGPPPLSAVPALRGFGGLAATRPDSPQPLAPPAATRPGLRGERSRPWAASFFLGSACAGGGSAGASAAVWRGRWSLMGRHCRWWPRGRVAAAGAGRWRARPLRPPLSASLRRVSLLALARTRYAYATLLRPRCRHLRLTLRFAILVPVASRRSQGTLRYACRPLSPALFPASCSPRFWATLRFAQTAVASLRDQRARRSAPVVLNAPLRFSPPPAHGSRFPARRPSFVSLTA